MLVARMNVHATLPFLTLCSKRTPGRLRRQSFEEAILQWISESFVAIMPALDGLTRLQSKLRHPHISPLLNRDFDRSLLCDAFFRSASAQPLRRAWGPTMRSRFSSFTNSGNPIERTGHRRRRAVEESIHLCFLHRRCEGVDDAREMFFL